MNPRVLGLLWVIVVHANAAEPVYHQRPVDPAADLLQLQRADAGSAEHWHARIALYTELGELEQMADLLPLLVARWPADPVFQEASLLLASQRGDHAAAIQIGEALLAQFPQRGSVRVNLARAQDAAGRPAQALNLMLDAIEIGPIRLQDWEFVLRRIAAADRSATAALARLQRKIDAHPDRKGLRYLQVVLMTRFGLLAEARAVLRTHPELTAHPELQRFIADGARETARAP